LRLHFLWIELVAIIPNRMRKHPYSKGKRCEVSLADGEASGRLFKERLPTNR
jgi:hypothetical protein